MSRANVLFGALVGAFIVYTTSKGNLRGYLQVLGLVK